VGHHRCGGPIFKLLIGTMNPYSIRMCLVYVIYIHRWIDITFNGSNVVNPSLTSPAAGGGIVFFRVQAVNDAANIGMCRLVVLECLAVA